MDISKLLKSKKGVSTNVISSNVEKIILVVVLFLVVAQLLPLLASAGDNISANGGVLGSLFSSSTGILTLLVLAGLILLVLGAFLKGGRK